MRTIASFLFISALTLLAVNVYAQATTDVLVTNLGKGKSGKKAAASIVTSLEMPGYDFKLIKISGQPVRLVVDSDGPVVVPLLTATKAAAQVSTSTGPGFLATFELANNSNVDRSIDFVDSHYANIKIAFTLFDSNGASVWQSYATEVDIPPSTPTVTLTLAGRTSWQKTVFVPLSHTDLSLLSAGDYTLQAEVIGTQSYMASAPFHVSILVGGPIIAPVPLTN